MILRRHLRRLVSTALFVAAASAALAAAGPDALVPFRDVAGAAADVSVAFVIDFGTGHPLVGCVKVPPSDNGYYALSAFLHQEHRTAPTYAASGLLCSIDGVPASGCGVEVSGGYIYWSYWTGTSGTWRYADTGASAAVGPGDVQGWRFEDPGHANPSDPAPAASADYAAICHPTPPPVTTTTTATTTTAIAGPAPTPPVTHTGTGGPPGSHPSGSTPTRGSGTPTDPGGSGHPATSDGGRASARGGTATARADRSGSPGHPGSTASTAPSGNAPAEALGATGPSGHPGGDSALPLLIGGLLVAALASMAVLRWRRRPGSP